MIPYGKQEVTKKDIEAVNEVLRSDFLTQGPVLPKFEESVAKYCSAKYGIATNSATSALHLACLALGVTAGDVVWTSSITFVASANCARYCGAQVDFIDIDPRTYNISTIDLEKKLKAAEKKGQLPKVVIPVHLCGQSCQMKKIKELSEDYGFSIIEDASHAIGAKYKNKPVGNCFYSDITVFSFHPVKIITTGEGGIALTNSKTLAEKMRLHGNHYITREPDKMTREPDGPWYYQQIGLGFNYRMTDIQAALGLSQLERLDKVVAQRHRIAERYNQYLAELSIRIPFQDPDTYSSFHLYVIRLKIEEIKYSHRQVFEKMRDAGIGVNLHYIPVYLQPYYRKTGDRIHWPHSEAYYKEAISLPMYHHMSRSDQDFTIDILRKILN